MIQHTTVPKKQHSFFQPASGGLHDFENKGQQTPTLPSPVDEPLSVPNATDIEEEKSNRPNETPILVSHWQEDDLHLREEHQTLRTKVPLHVSEAPPEQEDKVAEYCQKLEQILCVEEGAGNESNKQL